MAQTAGRVAKWVADQVFKAVLNWNETDAEAPDHEVYLQCGKVVFDNAPANLRTELWLSQLHRGSRSGAAAAAQYRAILQQGALNIEIVEEIDKDTHRTFPGHPRLSVAEGQQAMLNVLTAYAVLDPEIGYCQGMNFLVGLLLTYLPREEQAFGTLVLLMQERQLRELYKPDMSLLQVRLWQLGKLLPSALGEHLESLGVLPVLYASAWFLTCFGSDFPISFAARVLDVVITDCYAAPMMKVAVGILERCQDLLMEMQDMEMILEHLKQDVPKWPKPVLQDLLTSALAKPWTCAQLCMLEEMNGAETVEEAVERVNRLGEQAPPQQGAAGGAAAAAGSPGGTAREGGGTADMLGLGAAPGGSLWGAGNGEALSSCGRMVSQLSAAPTLGAQLSHQLSSWGPAAAHSWRGGGTAAAVVGEAGPATEAPTAARLVPLPPPPSTPGQMVGWEQWTAVSPAGLDTVPPSQLHIEPDIRDLPDLVPSLSHALSSLRATHSIGPLESPSGAPAGAATVTGGEAGPPALLGAVQQQQQQRSQAGGHAGDVGGGGEVRAQDGVHCLLTQHSHSSVSSTLPSPFESLPSAASSVGRWPSFRRQATTSPTPASSSLGARGTSTGSAGSDMADFGSFQRACNLPCQGEDVQEPPPTPHLHHQQQQHRQRQRGGAGGKGGSSTQALGTGPQSDRRPPPAAADALPSYADASTAQQRSVPSASPGACTAADAPSGEECPACVAREGAGERCLRDTTWRVQVLSGGSTSNAKPSSGGGIPGRGGGGNSNCSMSPSSSVAQLLSQLSVDTDGGWSSPSPAPLLGSDCGSQAPQREVEQRDPHRAQHPCCHQGHSGTLAQQPPRLQEGRGGGSARCREAQPAPVPYHAGPESFHGQVSGGGPEPQHAGQHAQQPAAKARQLQELMLEGFRRSGSPRRPPFLPMRPAAAGTGASPSLPLRQVSAGEVT